VVAVKRRRVIRRYGYERRFRPGDLLGAIGNGIAYAVFGLIGLALLDFLGTWGYYAWWVSTHCTLILGTRVCR
jgi:hypothetical protein